MSGLKSYGLKCSKQGQPTGSWDLLELGDHPYDMLMMLMVRVMTDVGP